MGKINQMVLGATEGVANFVFEGDYKAAAHQKIAAKRAKIEEKDALKAQVKAEKAEAKALKKASKVPLKEKVGSALTFLKSESKEVICDEEDIYSIFFDKDDNEYSAIIIEKNLLLDDRKEPLKQEGLKGQNLLRRNLKTSSLFINDDGNFIKVNSLQRVYPELDDAETAYILLETKYENFVIEFPMIQSF
ncbi:MAG: hypothetical protein J6A15_04375 [Clostridia bacterium]|nr:hypothetical protein [Clostridia bacterium]